MVGFLLSRGKVGLESGSGVLCRGRVFVVSCDIVQRAIVPHEGSRSPAGGHNQSGGCDSGIICVAATVAEDMEAGPEVRLEIDRQFARARVVCRLACPSEPKTVQVVAEESLEGDRRIQGACKSRIHNSDRFGDKVHSEEVLDCRARRSCQVRLVDLDILETVLETSSNLGLLSLVGGLVGKADRELEHLIAVRHLAQGEYDISTVSHIRSIDKSGLRIRNGRRRSRNSA